MGVEDRSGTVDAVYAMDEESVESGLAAADGLRGREAGPMTLGAAEGGVGYCDEISDPRLEDRSDGPLT